MGDPSEKLGALVGPPAITFLFFPPPTFPQNQSKSGDFSSLFWEHLPIIIASFFLRIRLSCPLFRPPQWPFLFFPFESAFHYLQIGPLFTLLQCRSSLPSERVSTSNPPQRFSFFIRETFIKAVEPFFLRLKTHSLTDVEFFSLSSFFLFFLWCGERDASPPSRRLGGRFSRPPSRSKDLAFLSGFPKSSFLGFCVDVCFPFRIQI